MSDRWHPFVKQIVVIGGLAACVWFVSRERLLLAPLIITLLLAYLLTFPVNAILHRTGWPRTLVVVLVYVVVLVVTITAPVLVVPRLVALGRSLGGTLNSVVSELAGAVPTPIHLTPSLTIDLGPFYAPVSQWLNSILVPEIGAVQGLQNLLFPFASGAAVLVRGAITGVLTTFFILVISFYLVKDWPSLSRFMITRLPEPMRPEFRWLWKELSAIWDAFVRSQFALGLTMGVITWILMTILGLRSAPALGLLSAVAEFMPGVGPFIAAAVGTLIALILGSTWLPLAPLWFAVVVAAIYFLLSQIENMYLLPRIVGRRISLHPVVVIIGALAGAELAGVLGILLAAPTIASVRLFFAYGFHKLLDESPIPAAAGPVEQGAFWRAQLRDHPVQAIFFDLDGTLIDTDDELIQSFARKLSLLGALVPEPVRIRFARRCLMRSESAVNGLITLLDRLGLDDLLSRLYGRLRSWRGIRREDRFVAVPGAVEMLQALAQRRVLAVVTSRSRFEASAFLDQYGLTDLFKCVVTRDDVTHLKPHPMPIRMAAQKLGVSLAQCAMVGDTSVDVRAAKAAGALSIGVLCGFGEPKDLEAADLVIESTAQVSEWL